jgi:hypothetical protein
MNLVVHPAFNRFLESKEFSSSKSSNALWFHKDPNERMPIDPQLPSMACFWQSLYVAGPQIFQKNSQTFYDKKAKTTSLLESLEIVISG